MAIGPVQLTGLGIEGEQGAEAGALAGAEVAADGVEVFSDEQAWDVLEAIPNASAAALILPEHHWAVPLRDAIASASGLRIGVGFVSPLDLARQLRPPERQGAVLKICCPTRAFSSGDGAARRNPDSCESPMARRRLMEFRCRGLDLFAGCGRRR
jgi:hypothetical protein